MALVAATSEFFQLGGILIAAILGGGIVKIYTAQAEKDHLQAENTALIVSTFEKALVEARSQITVLARAADECEADRKLLHREVRMLRVEIAELKDRLTNQPGTPTEP